MRVVGSISIIVVLVVLVQRSRETRGLGAPISTLTAVATANDDRVHVMPRLGHVPIGDDHESGDDLDPELTALAGLPPEDVEWVLDHVERAQSVRLLAETERLQLMAELASIRMFAVIERDEPMSPREEMMP